MKKVLLVVDMLNDFIDPEGALYCGPTADPIVPKVTELVNDYRKNGDVIVFLADAHAEDDVEFERFPKHAVAGTWGAEVIPQLGFEDQQEGKAFECILNKTRYNGFYDTHLDSLLEIFTGDVREDVLVEVCGVCTSICVMDTVGGLANRDYKIKVQKDAVADFDQEMHEMALKRMEALYGAEIV